MTAVQDLDKQLVTIANKLNKNYSIGFDLLINQNDNICHLRILCYQVGIRLSRIIPIIENFGFQVIDERVIHLSDADVIFYDFSLEVKTSISFNNNQYNIIKPNMEQGLYLVFQSKAEDDSLNSLVLLNGFNIREVALFRSFVKYLIHTNLSLSKQYIIDCFCKYNNIIDHLLKYFVNKFNPTVNPAAIVVQENNIQQEIQSLIDGIESIDADAIINTAYSLVKAIVRTNYYQTDDNNFNKTYISFKLASKKVLNLPEPLPLYEIFVYGHDFEGMHLRGDKVARGGIRWSDRNEDYRTEVLGLLKAQLVKNSVIVPSGSKGAFICKNLVNKNKEEVQTIGVACYKKYIAALLEITDNIVKGKIVKPKYIVCYDEDDPYLVVAADKGTSKFSDYANDLSIKFNFWLGDAFASGGSAGYDHKKLGITAKGAWESAKCHFKHFNINIQQQDFSAIGIGDMSGDVFGNGMLLSEHIQLKAAFNHLHIFLDPNPNGLSSYQERLRLFKLPYSSWGDYKLDQISEGGGVFSRTNKSIKLSSQVQEMLGVTIEEMNPSQLINSILKMKVDMLYCGGIGTYIKSSKQSNESVKDKSDDLLRVDADQVQAKVVVEGSNLGVTQLARIEFAAKGGNIFTDAIDNSAGVDCSDHEVNIKILFNSIVHDGYLNLEDRNNILEQMSPSIVQLVLRDNYLQTHILKLEQLRSYDRTPHYLVVINKLEEKGILNRSLEFLPSDNAVKERRKDKVGLLLPELSVLLSYTKMSLKQELLSSDIFDDPSFNSLLLGYFPQYLQDNYKNYIMKHYLKKEIIATQLSNLVVNREGIPFISRTQDEFDVSISQIVRMWWLAYNIFDGDILYKQISELEYKVSSQVLLEIMLGLSKIVEWTTQWLIDYFNQPQNIETLARIMDKSDRLSAIIEKLSPLVAILLNKIDQILPPHYYQQECAEEEKYLQHGVSNNLAKIVSRREFLPHIIDIVLIAIETNVNVVVVATNYYNFGLSLNLDWFRDFATALPRDSKWQILARSVLLLDIYKIYKTLMMNAIKRYGIQSDYVTLWQTEYRNQYQHLQFMVDDMRSLDQIDLSMIVYALRQYFKLL